jgi:lysophospholipase
VSVSVAFGRGEEYAPDRSGYDPAAPFEKNDVTHSRSRFEMNKEMISRRPEIALGGPTNRWVKESIRAGRLATRRASRLLVPALLLQAGADEIVRPGGQDRLCRAAPQCRKIVFAGAAHEILMETDLIRDQGLAEIRSFFRDRSGR